MRSQKQSSKQRDKYFFQESEKLASFRTYCFEVSWLVKRWSCPIICASTVFLSAACFPFRSVWTLFQTTWCLLSSSSLLLSLCHSLPNQITLDRQVSVHSHVFYEPLLDLLSPLGLFFLWEDMDHPKSSSLFTSFVKSETIMHTCQDLSRIVCECP